MASKFLELEFKTNGYFDVIDFTEQVSQFVALSEIKNGILNIQLLHTSCALIFNENEPLLLQDIKKSLESFAPTNGEYNHDNFEIRTVNMCDGECKNGHSHCKAVKLLPCISINVKDGKMILGQWQRIMLVELDRERPRKISIQLLGE